MRFLNSLILRTPVNPIQDSSAENLFDEAIYIASPALYHACLKYRSKQLSKKETEKIEISLYKYAVRAGNRCTPFGLFAGLTTGQWDDANHVLLDDNLANTLQRKTRLDMNITSSLAQEIGKRQYIKPFLKFYPNTSIYVIGANYRYIEYYYQDNRRVHKLSKVEYSEYLELIFSKEELTITEYATLLVSDNISEEEAVEFIQELIDAQLLISQFEPRLTGGEYFADLTAQLVFIYDRSQNSELKELISLLENVNRLIADLDEKVFNPIENYKMIFELLKTVIPNLNETNLFQTDLYKNTIQCTINKTIQQQIISALSFLNKVIPPYQNEHMVEFKKKFTELYEDAEVPLLIALDSETGIGYPQKDNEGINELIDGFYIETPSKDQTIKWNNLQACLHKIVTKAISGHKKVIQISESDFNDVDFSNGRLPDTIPVMFKVLNSALHKIVLEHAGGSSAINLIGRFAGGDPEILQIAKELTDFEQQNNNDKILAEIVHLPENRTGNILARPVMRPYEIPYMAKSGVDKNYQLSVNDLYVSLRNNRIVLRSKALNKEIIPRLGNAHNFSFNSLPVYHFLCDLQTQYYDKPALAFNWGALANQYVFLPRVEYNDIILSAAKWKLQKRDFEKLLDKACSDEITHQLFFELKNRFELPDKFLIADSDNELLIDCKLPIAISTFIDSLKNRQEISLEEYLFETQDALVNNAKKQAYTNECLAFILNEPKGKMVKVAREEKFIAFKSKQFFIPGSEWLYYKMYCGVKTGDSVLTEVIKPIATALLEKNWINKWFFIRYSDTQGPHIRVRFHVKETNQLDYIFQCIRQKTEPLIEQRIIQNIQIDTYKRELLRYGDTSIELAESVFYADSVFVSDMLDLIDPALGGTIRWQMAIRSVDAFLNDFGYSLNEKYYLISKLSQPFFIEHYGNKKLKLSLDDKFRKLRSNIDDALNDEADRQKDYYPLIELLINRSISLKPLVKQLLELQAAGNLQVDMNELISSFLHMNLDRLFMGRNRTNEFVVYEMLSRYYKSSLARLKKTDTNS